MYSKSVRNLTPTWNSIGRISHDWLSSGQWRNHVRQIGVFARIHLRRRFSHQGGISRVWKYNTFSTHLGAYHHVARIREVAHGEKMLRASPKRPLWDETKTPQGISSSVQMLDVSDKKDISVGEHDDVVRKSVPNPLCGTREFDNVVRRFDLTQDERSRWDQLCRVIGCRKFDEGVDFCVCETRHDDVSISVDRDWVLEQRNKPIPAIR